MLIGERLRKDEFRGMDIQGEGGGVYKERRGWRGKRCFEEERKEKRLMWKEGGLGCKNCFTVSGEN